jgi:putative Mg2+ transporter-C (MgtC) family protein
MNEYWAQFLSLGSAALIGGLIGIERELHRHGAGLRTHMMVAIGSTLFVQVSLSFAGNTAADVARVIQGVAAGIGFIGAGTILKLTDQREILGLTTAGSIWLAAAIGVACGVQQYAIACTAAAMALVILAAVGPLEKRWLRRRAERGKEEPGHESKQVDTE